MNTNKLEYVALGDSLTLGTGTLIAPGFVPRYVESIQQTLHKNVVKNVFAKNGATSKDILTALSRQNVQNAIQDADIITISAGGNDLVRAARSYISTKQTKFFEEVFKECMKNISAILTKIFELKIAGKYPYIIRLIGLYNPFPFIVFSDDWVQAFNRYLNSFKENNIEVADVYPSFKKRGRKVLSIDGLHPNGKGYEIIANELIKLGFEPLYY
ncbi:GDSL-type esterase/lipase family protein [Alkalihalobacillus sp. AL-G]|uniref:GDSL-type esterase/lipase family protein n=1 Tax=Alkalihalobacillus sp. AL-G TaxID=2926399 RepID=UPI00272B48E7|nr:GDSL-type esterase/lipase family protein [Alkalihalobacillus sp. AL-G]WLD91556.1 GDSL-type esterase/lipase family protein [Alkalihalobacillus sp. AL-G]